MGGLPGRQQWAVTEPRCSVIVPAHNEEAFVATTVEAALRVPRVDQVVVVDDGSTDRTAQFAAGAGALVVKHGRRLGKGAALETGVGLTESPILLFLDADLGATAAEAASLIESVAGGESDVAIGILPRKRIPSAGGFGFVVGLSRWGIRALTSWTAGQPLSGQRCLTREAFDAARPLAKGFGVEVAMTVDLLRKGFRVKEIETGFSHRVTGKDVRSSLHRARQLRDVMVALAPRFFRRTIRPPRLVLIVGQTTGGIGSHVAHLEAEVRRRGESVEVIGPEQIDIPETVSPIRLIRSAWRLASRLRGVDLVHAHGLRAGIVATLAGRRAGVPHRLVTIHNAVLNRSSRTTWVMNRALARLATVRICVSSDLAEVHRRVKPSRAGTVTVLPVGADLQPVSDEAIIRARESVGANEGSCLVVAVGRLHPQKGFDVLIEAVSRIDPSDAHFVIAGDGPQKQFLKNLVSAMFVSERVELLGERADARALIASADIFCMPSRWEGSPLALHEAMAAGRPIVATAVGGIPEMLSEDNSLLVPAEDAFALASALNRILQDRPLADRLGNAARLRAAQWPDASSTAAGVALLYETLIGRPRGPDA